MAKYKVGDKVRIVSERPSSCGFVDDMCKYLGTVMTISKVIESDNPSYKMEEDKGLHEFLLARVLLGDIADGWVWSEKWISGLAEEPKESKEIPGEPISVHIRFCGPLTVAELMKGGKVVKVSNARCNPKDTYDRGEGAKVAVSRLFKKKQKDVEETVNPAKKWKTGDRAVVVRENGMPYHFFHIPEVVKVMRVDLRDNTCLCRSLDDYEDVQWVGMDCLEPYKEAKK